MPQGAIPSPIDRIVELRGVEGAFEISQDGFPLRSVQSCTDDPEAVAAAVAAVMRLWRKIGSRLLLGNLDRVLLDFQKGKMIIGCFGSHLIVVFGTSRMVDGEVLANMQPVR